MKDFRKNIVLLPAEYNGVNNQKGILTLNFEDNKLNCNLKCFNIKNTTEEFLVGIVVNDQIFKTKAKANVLNNLTYCVPCKVKPADKVSCLILAVSSKDYEILLWGSTETSKAWQTVAVNRLENDLTSEGIIQNRNYEFNRFETNNETLNNTENNNLKCQEVEDYEYEKQQQEVEDYIDKVYNLTSSDSNNEENIVKEIDDDYDSDGNLFNEDYSQSSVFYKRVEKQVNNLLGINEPDEILQDILPNGKFCKVKMEEGYYVFGVIYDDNNPQYICYGIPCQIKGNPPKELEGFCQWLPLDINNQEGKGYWISYQDAKSGENIKVEVIS